MARDTEQLGQVRGPVEGVEVDLASKQVVVRGEALDDAALRAAIERAGYQAG